MPLIVEHLQPAARTPVSAPEFTRDRRGPRQGAGWERRWPVASLAVRHAHAMAAVHCLVALSADSAASSFWCGARVRYAARPDAR